MDKNLTWTPLILEPYEVLANLKIWCSIVIPGKRSAIRNPDFSGCSGFPLEFIPHLMRGGNDGV